MLKPSYAELMDVINENADEDSTEVTSRYTIVIAAAKRARQLIDGDEPMVASADGKAVSTAVNEINENKIKIVPKGKGTVLKIYEKTDDEAKDDLKALENHNKKKKELLSDLESVKADNAEDEEVIDEITDEDAFDDAADDEPLLDDAEDEE
jgi:DNA-directed RNA polymerase subunit omega